MPQYIILILRPLEYWGIVTAEMKWVDSLCQYMILGRTVRAELLSEDQPEELRQMVTLCEELTPHQLYSRYANKKMFRREQDFWDSTDSILKQHTKRMADMRIGKIVRLADSLDIPILYAPTEKTPLHITNRLYLQPDTVITPVMNFRRHGGGTEYRLQLRFDGQLEEHPSEHEIAVLTYNPGMFAFDNHIYIMGESHSGQLLLPFTKKPVVAIPRRIENDYFRRFILKNVAKVEIHTIGFDIDDIHKPLHPHLTLDTTVDGHHILTLRFWYGNESYVPDNQAVGRVKLKEENDSFHFTRLIRDTKRERQYIEQLCLTGVQIAAQGYIFFDSLAKMIDWLRQHGPQLRQQGFDIIQPSDQVYHIGPLSVEQSDTWNGDWLQTDVTIVLDEGRLRIPFRDLRESILRGEQEYMLPTGERLLIPGEWLQRYANLLLIGKPKGKGFQRHSSQLTETEEVKKQKPQNTIPATIPAKLQATLRPYQEKGYKWLWRNFQARTGCCLSDEMGLGKTLQTIALLLKYKETAKTASTPQPMPGFLFTEEEMMGSMATEKDDVDVSTPFLTSLVVAPASVVHNWKNELCRFAPSLQVCLYTGDVSRRRDIQKVLTSHDIVLTTYRTLLNDIDYLSEVEFGIVVFDESQAFKTATSQIHKAVLRLKSLHSMALSGTPVENNLNELWSLMSVLNPNLLGDARSFQQTFINPIARQMEESRTALLRRMIAPYFLKRTKGEVLKDLPPRQDEVVICPMTETQVSNYAEELSRARNEWMDTNVQESRRQINMLTAIQRLRQIANGEGKMCVVFEQLENLRGTRHKVLIFSEYVSLLERVGQEMQLRGWSYEMLTGQTLRREQVIAHFQNDIDCQFFLISLKAGGVGLNLTAADYVFLLDPWWNLAAEEQAIARSHRIGQHHPVFVYRFVAENTLEEQILSLQERKQTLIDSVMPFILR